jgi:hypothetical protein
MPRMASRLTAREKAWFIKRANCTLGACGLTALVNTVRYRGCSVWSPATA